MYFPPPDPEWTIVQEGFDLATNRHYEGAFATGSGYMHVRGCLEEGFAGDPQDLTYDRQPDDVTLEPPAGGKSKWGTFVPGIVGPHPLLREEIVNLPWFLGLVPEFDGERLDMEHSTVADHRRLLDLRHGSLYRHLTWRTKAGAELVVAWRRYISLARKNLSVQELEVRVLSGTGRLRLTAGIDADVRTSGYDHFQEVDWPHPDGNRIACAIRTNGGNGVAVAMRLLADDLAWEPAIRGRRGETNTARRLAPGALLRLVKLSAVATDRDPTTREPLYQAEETLTEGAALGAEALYAEHARAWEKRWQDADLVIEGDPEAQRAMRFSLYHLLRCQPAGDPRVAICPKGYGGDAYYGRYFWDTEIYLLPFYIYTNPSAAKDLVLFRCLTLPGARINAAALGYRGARYAWESSLDGTEQCPNWQYADLEVHVTADVVYGLCHYVAATDDRALLEAHGLELMVETCRYWVERADRDPAPGRYNLIGVMGPDEYTPFSRNNAFTNHLVKFVLARTVSLLGDLRAARPEAYAALAGRVGLADGEIETFAAVALGLTLPRADGLVLQAEDFPSLADLDLARLWPDRSQPIGRFVPRERRYRSKCLKQADVLALMALFPQDFTRAEMETAYSYYEPLTSHDSSLSPTIHAIIAAWLGYHDEAYRFFRRSAGIDLDPVQGGAAEGIHIANAGGNWMAVVHGFAGVRNALQSEMLHVEPHLPPAWQRLGFTLIWHGCPVRIEITHHEIHALNRGAHPIPAVLEGRALELMPGVEAVVRRAGGTDVAERAGKP